MQDDFTTTDDQTFHLSMIPPFAAGRNEACKINYSHRLDTMVGVRPKRQIKNQERFYIMYYRLHAGACEPFLSSLEYRLNS